MSKFVEVEQVLHTSSYGIRKNIPKLLENCELLSFDCETRSVYNKEEIAEAKTYLKGSDPSDKLYKHARVVAESSGLSYPSIVKTTHFIFGESKNKVHTVICNSPEMEIFLWNLVANYEGKFLVHNSLFDFKLCYQRTGRLPKNFTDTALFVKCLINHVNIWKSKVGLKDLVGDYYPPSWSLYNDYEPINLKDEKFLTYCSYDGSGVWVLYELIQEELGEVGNNES